MKHSRYGLSLIYSHCMTARAHVMEALHLDSLIHQGSGGGGCHDLLLTAAEALDDILEAYKAAQEAAEKGAPLSPGTKEE